MRRFPIIGASRLLLGLTAGLVAVVLVLVLAGGSRGDGARALGSTAASATTTGAAAPQIVATTALAPTRVPSVSVGAPLKVRPVASGFLGLSLEYYVITEYAGGDPNKLNPGFLQLVRNLNPGQQPVLRIGGDSTDWAWLPTAGVSKADGLKVEITPQMIAVLAAMTKALNAKVILGINLEDDNLKLAAHMADALVSAVGASRVEALELGNEPELYDVLGWYANRAGQPVLGRPRPYTLADYQSNFNAIARGLPKVSTAGPAAGSAKWLGDGLAGFVRQAARLSLVTVHAYPMQTCGTHPGLPTYPTISKLLSASSTLGLARAQLPFAVAAHRAGKPIRVDEINSVACFGLKGVSNTYAAGLWSLETAFQFARLGFDGLNLPTLPSSQYRLWYDKNGKLVIAPEYYGLLAFADAVPAGSEMLATPDRGANPQVFAVRTPSGQTHVVIVNTGAARTLGVRIAGADGAEATATYLLGPALAATSGVTLAGQSFGAATTTGTLTGTARGVAVKPVAGAYVVKLPAHSATTLTLP